MGLLLLSILTLQQKSEAPGVGLTTPSCYRSQDSSQESKQKICQVKGQTDRDDI